MTFTGNLTIRQALWLNNFEFVKLFGYWTVPLIIKFYGRSLLGISSILIPRKYIGHNKSLLDKNVQYQGYPPYIKCVLDIII